MKEVMHVACLVDENAPVLAKEDLAKRTFERLAQMEGTES
jgi:hypothetical protein